MTGPLVRVARSDAVDVAVLASPRNRNALSLGLMDELLEAVRRSAAGDGRALILDHEGPTFCAGADLRERQALGPGNPEQSLRLTRLLQALWAYPKPLLCRVAGAVRGGGMGLVACADIVAASTDATFAFSEVRVGVAPALVAAVALAKSSHGLLLPWLLTGEAFDAEVARRMGLVTRVSPEDPSLTPEAAAILASAPNAVQVVKRLARRLGGSDVHERLEEMVALSAELFAAPEAIEGMAAFAERRSPGWATSNRRTG